MTEIRVSKIRVSEIRVTEIHLSEIRVSKIRISSNHRELHGAIFSLPGQLFFLYLVKGYQNQLPWSSAFQNCCWNCSISLSFWDSDIFCRFTQLLALNISKSNLCLSLSCTCREVLEGQNFLRPTASHTSIQTLKFCLWEKFSESNFHSTFPSYISVPEPEFRGEGLSRPNFQSPTFRLLCKFWVRRQFSFSQVLNLLSRYQTRSLGLVIRGEVSNSAHLNRARGRRGAVEVHHLSPAGFGSKTQPNKAWNPRSFKCILNPHHCWRWEPFDVMKAAVMSNKCCHFFTGANVKTQFSPRVGKANCCLRNFVQSWGFTSFVQLIFLLSFRQVQLFLRTRRGRHIRVIGLSTRLFSRGIRPSSDRH